jgi:hypothetical protein
MLQTEPTIFCFSVGQPKQRRAQELSSRFRSTDDQKDLDADMQIEAASTPPG